MKTLIPYLLIVIVIFSCKGKEGTKAEHNIQTIVDLHEQDSLFKEIVGLAGGLVPASQLSDSLSFLILPVEAACPSCRNKTIDSINKYKAVLDDRHFIIVSGSGKARIENYFLDRKHELPNNKNILIDTTNEAFVHELVFTKPVIYNTFNSKVYEKVSCVPTTIKKDLKVYFGGLTANTSLSKVE